MCIRDRSLAPKADVMHSISMSFGRFTFTQAGTFGTILMAFLLLIYYFTSLIKPIVMIILVGGLISVSYTHLDVYKRQIFGRSMTMLKVLGS